MRLIGILLLIVGFLWIVWDAADSFVSFQHAQWIWQTKNLPAGDTIQRTDAADAMRELSLTLKDRHRKVLLPASMMLIGGLIVAFGQRRPGNEQFAASPNR